MARPERVDERVNERADEQADGQRWTNRLAIRTDGLCHWEGSTVCGMQTIILVVTERG